MTEGSGPGVVRANVVVLVIVGSTKAPGPVTKGVKPEAMLKARHSVKGTSLKSCEGMRIKEIVGVKHTSLPTGGRGRCHSRSLSSSAGLKGAQLPHSKTGMISPST